MISVMMISSFRISSSSRFRKIVLLRSEESSDIAGSSKGFGKVKAKTEEIIEKDDGTKTYESQAKRGVPEYNIFLRPTNGTEEEWVPVGSMTIPRDTKVSKAVYEVEAELLKGTFKLYPKLKAFSDTRNGKEGLFEYGYCMKAFPDEPIVVIKREDIAASNGNFFTNWLSKMTSPIDTDDLKNKGQMTLKQ
jgi:hypothetical protein